MIFKLFLGVEFLLRHLALLIRAEFPMLADHPRGAVPQKVRVLTS